MSKNKYDLTKEYGIGYDYKGESFLFDLEDYEKIKDYKWIVTHKARDGKAYVTAAINNKCIYMHRFVMNAEEYNYYNPIDHRDNNGTDNRKYNLRNATPTQNNFNNNTKKNNSSGIIGVHYEKSTDRWRAEIQCYRIKKRKSFKEKVDAIIQRLKFEKEICGEFAPQKHLFTIYGII
jgi:hypothetical protein